MTFSNFSTDELDEIAHSLRKHLNVGIKELLSPDLLASYLHMELKESQTADDCMLSVNFDESTIYYKEDIPHVDFYIILLCSKIILEKLEFSGSKVFELNKEYTSLKINSCITVEKLNEMLTLESMKEPIYLAKKLFIGFVKNESRETLPTSIIKLKLNNKVVIPKKVLEDKYEPGDLKKMFYNFISWFILISLLLFIVE